ncbi:MAG: nitroreductase [Labrys sp. (in: a-proteobacteria)]
MPDALDLMRTRRSVPPLLLSEPGPSAEQLREILTIASRVPDHGKLSPWRFILFAGEARTRASAIVETAFMARNPAAEPAVRQKEATRFSLAPLVIAVVSRAGPHEKIPEWEQELSAGAVCQNILVAASALGFGASWLTGWYAYDRAVLAELGVGEGERVAGFIHVGTPRERVPDRPRPDLDGLVSHFA